jgi:ATP-dependent Clp protease adaptor protein ClpS
MLRGSYALCADARPALPTQLTTSLATGILPGRSLGGPGFCSLDFRVFFKLNGLISSAAHLPVAHGHIKCKRMHSFWPTICSIDQRPGNVRECRAIASSPGEHVPMGNITSKPRTKVQLKTERPRLHKVILVNDDFTPREFVVAVLKAEFRMNEDQAYRVMMTAHRRGSCVVAVYAKDVAETKATRGTEAGRSKGYPLLFTTEPEE